MERIGTKQYDILRIKRVHEYMISFTIEAVYEDENQNQRNYIEFCDIFSIKGLKIDPIFGHKPEHGSTKYENYLLGFNIFSDRVKRMYFDVFGSATYDGNERIFKTPTNIIVDLDGNQFQNSFLLAQDAANIINPLLAVQKQYNVL